jgi:DNA glycosylase AlkZ-like
VGDARPRIDVAERRRRIGARHALAQSVASVDEAARSVLALHGTDPASVYLSAWARVPGLTHADVDDALYESRTVVKHMAMRRTVWVVPTDLMPVVQSAASDLIAATERRRLARDLERCGVTDDPAGWMSEAERAAVAALGENGPSLGRELTDAVPMLRTKITSGTSPKAQEFGVITRIATILSASGQVTRGRAGGTWRQRQPRWVLMADWAPAAVADPPLPATEARTDLVRHWLRVFGPGTFDDIKWWTGWTVAFTRAALADAKAVEVMLDDGATGYLLPDNLEPTPDAAPWVSLLPSLDPTTMAWRDRDWYLGPHRLRLFDPYGNAGPAIWSDGRVVGGWGQRPDSQVVLEFLEDVGTEVRAAAEAQAAALTGWLDGEVVKPSFPTPLQRELSA